MTWDVCRNISIALADAIEIFQQVLRQGKIILAAIPALANQNIYTITWLTLVKILLLLIKLGKIDSFNWSNYKYLIKKIYLLKKINFYISNIITSIILIFGTYCDIQQVIANICRNVKIITL